jgi:hypothetical protein
MVTVAGGGPEADGLGLDGEPDPDGSADADGSADGGGATDGTAEGEDGSEGEGDPFAVGVGLAWVAVGPGDVDDGGEPGAMTIATAKPIVTMRTSARPNATRRH